MNLSATFLIDQYLPEIEQLLPKCKYLFGNEDEFAHLGKTLKVDDVVTGLRQKYGSGINVIMTRGSKPVVVGDANGNIREYAVPNISPEKIKDTNGAGDSFVGGFLSQIAIGG